MAGSTCPKMAFEKCPPASLSSIGRGWHKNRGEKKYSICGSPLAKVLGDAHKEVSMSVYFSPFPSAAG